MLAEREIAQTIDEAVEKQPERQLLAAVFLRALLDYFSESYSRREGAEAWLFEDDDLQDSPFSCEWVCRQLGLDRSEVLRRIRGMGELDPVRTQYLWGMKRLSLKKALA